MDGHQNAEGEIPESFWVLEQVAWALFEFATRQGCNGKSRNWVRWHHEYSPLHIFQSFSNGASPMV